jgi:hypothetical protein
MLKHYIKIALRNLSKQKTLAAINIIGLSIGLSSFLLFTLYAVNEFIFDQFHKNANDIYREYLRIISQRENMGGNMVYHSMPLGPVIVTPLALYFMNSWLQSFAYRITVGSSVILIASISILLIAFITFSLQTINAALTSPVKGIKTV